LWLDYPRVRRHLAGDKAKRKTGSGRKGKLKTKKNSLTFVVQLGNKKERWP